MDEYNTREPADDWDNYGEPWSAVLSTGHEEHLRGIQRSLWALTTSYTTRWDSAWVRPIRSGRSTGGHERRGAVVIAYARAPRAEVLFAQHSPHIATGSSGSGARRRLSESSIRASLLPASGAAGEG